MDKYIKRIVEDEISINLKVFGAILVEGLKYCGKSTTCKTFAKTIIEFQDDKSDEDHEIILNTGFMSSIRTLFFYTTFNIINSTSFIYII